MSIEETAATPTLGGAAARGGVRHPGLLPLTYSRTVLELKQFFRQPESAVFTFALPILLLLLFGSPWQPQKGPPGVANVNFRQYFLAGMIASGVMSACFNNLAISISLEQSEGMLKLLALTPLPPAAYFGGKLVSCLLISIIETVLMLILGVALFGISLPVDLMHWAVFAAVLVVGVATCTLLGIAYTR